MIGEADELSGNTQNQSPQKMTVLCEIPAVHNTEVDNNVLNTKDQNANLPHTGEQTMEDSDEDEPIIRTKAHKKASRHILDDSDSEQEDSGIPTTNPVAHSESSNDVPAGSDTEDKENAPSSAKKKKRVVSRLDSDSDSDGASVSGREGKGNVPTSDKKKKRVMSRLDSDSDSDGSADDNIPLRQKPKAVLESDDSGNEDSSNHGDKASDGSDSDGSNRSNADSDDDDDPPELTEELKKKLAKGAAKKGKKQSYSRKAKTDAITEIHAETQRIVRESEVRLPYHNPRPLGLSAILARAQQKQEHLSNMKRAWKTPPPTTVADGKESLISRATALLNVKAGTSPTLSKPAPSTEGEAGVKEAPVPLLDLQHTGDVGKDDVATTNTPQEAVSMENDDELPDITPTNHTTPQATIPTNHTTPQATIPTNHTTPQAATQITDNADIDTEQPAQDKTPEAVMVQQDEEPKPELQTSLIEAQGQGQDDAVLSKTPSAKTPQVSKTPVSKTPRSRTTALTPKFANLDVSVKPTLSGGPDTYIDLDFDEPKTTTPKPGVLDLMDRLVKHSATRLKKGAKDVEVSTVEKVQVEGDRQELQLKKMTVHITGEAEQSPANEKPGAKLTSLKQTLAQKMREKREEARQARCQMYALDNEEGFMGEEEEEAELTEGEETDEEQEEPEEEEEEEMDEDGYTATEKANKVANPFVDDEAEDDDDDGDDGLHLALDGEDDTQQSTQSAASTQPPPVVEPKAFLHAALHKTNTLQLFDDDAISESPTLSQQSNKDNIAVSERPFEQLSGETLKATGGDTDMEDNDEVNTLHMDVDDDVTMLKTAPRPHLLREVSVSSADNSFDQIPAGQGTGGKKNRFRERHGTPEVYTPSSKSSLGAKSLSKMSDLAMPIEDSQDLLGGSPLHLSQSTPRNFAGLDDSNTESQSHLLDDDGLLRPKSSGNKIRRQLNLMSNSDNEDHHDGEILGLCSGQFSTQSNKTNELLGLCSGRFPTQSNKHDDELLGLCSGQFTTQPAGLSSSKSSFGGMDGLSQLMTNTQQGSQDDILGLCSGQFSGASVPTADKAGSPPGTVGGSFGFKTSGLKAATGIQGTQGGNMDELIGLCSGQFSDNKKDTSPMRVKKVKKKKQRRRIRVHESDDEEGDGDNEGDDFEVAAAGSAGGDMEQEDLDSDEDLGLQLEDGSDDEEAQLARAEKKKPMKMANFVEAEAELSGSEYDSDENYDIDAKDDMLEACSGDEDELPSDDELRDQVGRVHMKTIIDEDKRELRLMQEMYLPDGDLYSEGGGRTRRFRWKNVDDDTQQDMFQESDEEKEDENIEAQKWRLERHEREKFLSEQQEEEQGGEGEPSASQVLKLGKVVFKPKKAQLTKQPTIPVVEAEEKKEKEPKTLFKVPKCGSFLSRGKDTLAKIAEMSKPVSTNINGPRHSRGFLFSSMSKDDEDEEDTKKPTAVRRSLSHPPPNQPASKKPRLEKTKTLPGAKNSIFDHF